MIEKLYQMKQTNEKSLEKIIGDNNLHYMQIVLGVNEEVVRHNANADLYITVLRGLLSIQLGEQDYHTYPKGTIVNVPYNTPMHFKNSGKETLEITVVKIFKKEE